MTECEGEQQYLLNYCNITGFGDTTVNKIKISHIMDYTF